MLIQIKENWTNVTYSLSSLNLHQNGWTALHFAAEYDNAGGASLLLADPRVSTQQMDNDGWTAVMTAMRYDKVNTLRVLAAHPSANLDIRDGSLEDWGRWELITKFN